MRGLRNPDLWRRVALALALLVAALALLAAFISHKYFSGGSFQATQWTAQAPTLAADLQAALDREMDANPQSNGMLLYVLAPRLGLNQSFAAGSSGTERLRSDHVIRIASNTKTYTAVAVLALVERGAFTLRTPIRDLISPQTAALLASDGYDLDAIEVRHLLSHAAGMPDYGEHPAYMFDSLWRDLLNRRRTWTRAQQIAFAMRHTDPLGAPGDQFSYSDTGYILLGEIIERATGTPLPTAIRDLCQFRELELTETWWEQMEAAPPGRVRAHQYMGVADTYQMNPTLDLYGGGGIIASIGDLGRFTRASVRGELYTRPETLTAMLTPVALNPRNYSIGVYALDIGGERCWGHVGFWGTIAFHCPRSDITVARSFSQANTPDLDHRLINVVEALQALQQPGTGGADE
jgi:D-alanyl-D-alanine carboxypeptidase